MKKKALLISLIILIVVLLGGLLFKNQLFGYFNNYFRTIKLGDSGAYEDIVAKKGKPTRVKVEGGWRYAKYDDCTLAFNEDNFLQNASITSNQIHYGIYHIGVDSTKENVEKAYRHIVPIKDLESNELGFIDREVWVVYQFGKDDCVKNIVISYGP